MKDDRPGIDPILATILAIVLALSCVCALYVINDYAAAAANTEASE